MRPSRTHLVIIPSYNSGKRLLSTVADALAAWKPVWVVDDGSDDGSVEAVLERFGGEECLRVVRNPRNRGKGAAVLEGAGLAFQGGFTHALALDADGQHPCGNIGEFMRLSEENPAALVAGLPRFGDEAPKLRLYGRKLTIFLVWVEVGGSKLRDPLFGFRVYPLKSFLEAMCTTRWARRYDFDAEAGVRMAWAGVPVLNVPANCRYLSASEGGVSHFRYVPDNLRMIALHARLITELLVRRRWRRPKK